MADYVESDRPVRPRPIDQIQGAATLRRPNSKAFMAAQKAMMRSIEESVTKLKAERERFFREGKNSEE